MLGPPAFIVVAALVAAALHRALRRWDEEQRQECDGDDS